MMTKEDGVRYLTDTIAKFVGITGKILPDDVMKKLKELREKEQEQLPKIIYGAMFQNQDLAAKLNRPSCQDTGVIQFFVKCGANFPYIGELGSVIKRVGDPSYP